MKLLYHPDFDNDENKSSFAKFLEKELGHHPLRKQVVKILDRIKASDSIDNFIKSGQIKYLQSKLLELRIPPVKKGGVVRIYFCFAIDESQTLIILDAELKHDTAPKRIERAHERYNFYKKEHK